MFDPWRGFAEEQLSAEWRHRLTEMVRRGRGDIVKMTTVAGSGHPGGSMSSLETFLMLYNFARVNPKDPAVDDRDRIVVSHGHTSPGAYVALAYAGFFDVEPALWSFRRAGSPFEGHVEQSVPGVEWDTGNLGQGLAVAVGKAIYARLSKQPFHCYVTMGDGEQQKGMIAEARRHAAKFQLHDITVVVDYNGLQISGAVKKIHPQNIKADWEADGWKVLEVDGHNLDQLYEALRKATHDHDANCMIFSHSVMGKGVSFMENNEAYHGAAVKVDKVGEALAELGVENDVDRLLKKRAEATLPVLPRRTPNRIVVQPGESHTYPPEHLSDNRSAWGKALLSVAEANMTNQDFAMAVFDCDLAGSVKTQAFGEKYPGNFFQMGITEHSTAVAAGSLSAERALAVFADFGMFAIVEPYNQQRLNDINRSNLKLVCTHSGVDVGEDGKTHQCIDYFGLLNSTFGWKVITPADPNQTDRVARYALLTTGNFAVVMGRSKTPIITTEDGRPFFGEDYVYRYGRMETVREGENLVLAAAGNMLAIALNAWKKLADVGLRVTLVGISDWSDLHPEDLAQLAAYKDVVVLEDHNYKTGLGTAIGAALAEHGLGGRLTRLGVSGYAVSGKPAELYRRLGLDADSVAGRIRHILETATTTSKVGS